MFVPVIAGISYEFIRLAGSSESKIVAFLSKPGLWLQGLTTKEPDDDMIRVAVASVEAVFDWQAYLDENFSKKNKKKNGKAKKAADKAKSSDNYAPVIAEAKSSEVVIEPADTEVKPFEETKVQKPVVQQEQEEIASKFDWSFPSAKKDEPDEETARESRSRLVEKVSAADRAETAGKAASSAIRYTEEEEEEDEILRALDKFFVFEGEGTVMERSGDKEH